MRLALFYNFDILPGDLVPALYAAVEQQAIRADQLGFAAIWLAEHHFTGYGRLPAPLLFLARLSALTHQIALGTAVVEAPYYHPLRLAEDAALLDLVSGGRLRLGIGTGAANKSAEFATFGVPLAERGARTAELLIILQQAFATGSVTFCGQHFHYADAALNPQLHRPAADVIWLAASDTTVVTAAEHGYGLLIPRVGAAAHHRALTRRYRAALGPRAGRVAQLRFVFVAPTEAEAQAQTARTFARYAQYDCGVTWDGRTDTAEYAALTRRMNMVIGAPEQVIRQLRAWQAEDGVDELICQVFAAGVRPADAMASIELLGQQILPAVQRETAALEEYHD